MCRDRETVCRDRPGERRLEVVELPASSKMGGVMWSVDAEPGAAAAGAPDAEAATATESMSALSRGDEPPTSRFSTDADRRRTGLRPAIQQHKIHNYQPLYTVSQKTRH